MAKYFGRYCCVPTCKSNTSINREVSFHRFPKNTSLSNIWVERINRVEKKGRLCKWRPTKWDVICGLHFNATGKKSGKDVYPRFFPHKTYPPAPISAEDELEAEVRKLLSKVDNETDNAVADVKNIHSYSLPYSEHTSCAPTIKQLKMEISGLNEKVDELSSEVDRLKYIESQYLDLQNELKSREIVFCKEEYEMPMIKTELPENT